MFILSINSLFCSNVLTVFPSWLLWHLYVIDRLWIQSSLQCPTAMSDFLSTVDQTWKPSHSDLQDHLTSIPLIYDSCRLWYIQLTARSRKCLSVESSKTRNIWKENQSWKFCWHAREPNTKCTVRITRKSPNFQRALGLGHMFIGALLHM